VINTQTHVNSRQLLRRGFALEYVTLGWNVVGIVLLVIAAVSATSVALAGFGMDSLIRSVPRPLWCGNCPAPESTGNVGHCA
jgi:hypothetical protein